MPDRQQPGDGPGGGANRNATHRNVIAFLLSSAGQLDAERAGDGCRIRSQHLVELTHPVKHEVAWRGGLRSRIGEHHGAGAGWQCCIHAAILHAKRFSVAA